MPVSASDVLARSVPVVHNDEREHRRLLAEAVNRALQGHIHSVVDVDLDVSPATSTSVTDLRAHASVAVLVSPLDAAAAGDLASIYVTPGDQSFTIYHPANASARAVRCVLVG